MDTKERRNIAEKTMQCVRHGSYKNQNGQIQSLNDQLKNCRKYRCEYDPRNPVWVSSVQLQENKVQFEVTNETTIQACIRLWERTPLVLNFASGLKPGGGFLTGGNGQEESICRSSALYSMIRDSRMYEFNNRNHRAPYYSDWMTFTPSVPVFRDDDGNFLDGPIPVAFVNAAAVNRSVRNVNHTLANKIMSQRMHKVLRIAAANNFTHLILGAWGCGVFQNQPRKIAQLWHEVLSRFDHAFETITFVIPNDKIRQEFEKLFRTED